MVRSTLDGGYIFRLVEPGHLSLVYFPGLIVLPSFRLVLSLETVGFEGFVESCLQLLLFVAPNRKAKSLLFNQLHCIFIQLDVAAEPARVDWDIGLGGSILEDLVVVGTTGTAGCAIACMR